MGHAAQELTLCLRVRFAPYNILRTGWRTGKRSPAYGQVPGSIPSLVIKAQYCILGGDKVTFQAWRSKASATLDDAECLEICKGTKTIPTEVPARFDDDHSPTNEAEMEQYTLDVKSFRKR